MGNLRRLFWLLDWSMKRMCGEVAEYEGPSFDKNRYKVWKMKVRLGRMLGRCSGNDFNAGRRVGGRAM